MERVIESIEIKIRTATNSKKTKEDAIQLLLEFGQMYPTLPGAEQKKIANVLIESIEIFPTKRAYGYLKTIHFLFPVLSGDEIKQTMSIWDTHPDILDDEGNFNGYNPEDDLPPVEMEAGTIVVHDEGEVFPPKRITDETVVLLSREKADDHIRFSINTEELKQNVGGYATYGDIKAYVLENYGLKVSSLNIGQTKDKCGIKERENYNKGKDGHRVPNCPPEKEQAIMDAFRHFGILRD